MGSNANDVAIAAHREKAHFQHYLSEIGDLAERTALIVDPVDIA